MSKNYDRRAEVIRGIKRRYKGQVRIAEVPGAPDYFITSEGDIFSTKWRPVPGITWKVQDQRWVAELNIGGVRHYKSYLTEKDAIKEQAKKMRQHGIKVKWYPPKRKITLSTRGVAIVMLRVNGKYQAFSVGRTVLQTFGTSLKSTSSTETICFHKDGNPLNNTFHNLEWRPNGSWSKRF